MSMSEAYVHEILEASFDGACADEQRLKFARIVDDRPEVIGSLVEEAFIHSLLHWHSEVASPDLAVFAAIVASKTDDTRSQPC